jgi:hypothetical protein
LDSSKSILFHGLNVTLRGVVPSEDDDRPPTVLRVAASREPRPVFLFGRDDLDEPLYSKHHASDLTEDYVPTGRSWAKVKNAAVFKVGQFVEVQRTVSSEWVKAVQMNRLFRDGERQVWIPTGTLYRQLRQIRELDTKDHIVTFNMPLTDSLNNTLGAQGRIVAYTPPEGRTARCGIENLSILSEKDYSGQPIDFSDDPAEMVIFNPFSQDNWMRQIFAQGFNQFVAVQAGAQRITLQDLLMSRPSPTDVTAGSPAE